MKIKLIFTDWQQDGISIYNTDEGFRLSSGDFHSGTTFNGEIDLPWEDAQALKEAFRKGYQPVFYLAEEK